MLRQKKKISGFAPSTTGVGEGASHFKKIILVIVCIALLSCLFCIPASAETIETSYLDFWTFNRSDSKIWLVDSENNDNLVDITTSAEFTILENGKGMGVTLRTGQDFDVGTVFYFNMVFDLNPEYIKPGYSSLKFELYEFNNHAEWTVDQAKYSPWSYRVGNYQIDNVWRRDYQATHSTPDWNTKGIKINFDTQYAEYGFKGVNVFAYCTLNQPMTEGSYHHVYFGFYKLDYRYSTDGEYLNNRVIENQNENTDKIISNADKNASDIQANQDKNTQSIIDNQNQLAENEKNETNEIGNEGVGEITEAVPDYSANIIQAFNKLTKPMIHQNTDCIIEFPGIKIPSLKISVMGMPLDTPEMVLLEKQNIDIENEVKKIPKPILIVVRALLGCALYIFCYKEFYHTVEYIMTLKGASK